MSKLIKVGILISGRIGQSVKRATDAAVKDQGRIGTAISKVNAQMGHGKEARKYGRLLNDLKKKQSALGYSSERLDRGIEDVERRYNEARRAASRYGSQIGEVERKTRRLGETQRKNRDGLDKGQIGKAVGAIGGAALTAGVVGGGNREEDGLYLRTVINARDGDKDAAVARSRASARDFSRQTRASEREIINIEYALNSAGLEEDVSRAGSRMVHKVAQITKGNSSQVGEIIGTTFNNLGNQMMGTAEEKMERIGNILTKTQFKFQIRDFGQLGASMEYGLATAASYKIGLEQTAASIGFLNSAGFQGSRGGTTFAAVMRSMTKAGDELGFSMIRNADGSLDFIKTMRELGASLEGLETDEKADRIGKIFGDEGKGGVIAMLNDLDRLKAGYEDVNAAANSDLVNEEYSRFLKSSVGGWTMIRQNIGQAGTSIGSDLLPVVNAVLEPVGKLIGGLAWGIDTIPGVGLAVGVLGTAVVGLGVVMGATTTATWAWNAAMAVSTNRMIVGRTVAFAGGMMRLGGAMRFAAIGTRIFGLALLASPIGWVIAGVTALAVGAYFLIKNWEPVALFFGGTFSKISDGADFAWSTLKTVASWSPIGLVKRAWDGLPSVYSGTMDLGKNIIKVGAQAMISPLMAPIKLVESLWNKIRGVKKDASTVRIGSAINDNAPHEKPNEIGKTVNHIQNHVENNEVNRTVGETLNHVRNDVENNETTRRIGESFNTAKNTEETNRQNHVENSEVNRTVGETLNHVRNDVENNETTRRIGESFNTAKNTEETNRQNHVENSEVNRTVGETLNHVRNDVENNETTRRIGETFNTAKNTEETSRIGKFSTLTHNRVINETENRESTIRVGSTINDNNPQSNDNDFNPSPVERPRRQTRAIGAAYAEFEGYSLNGPQAVKTPIQAPRAVPAPQPTTHTSHYAGDTNTYVFHGVLDGEEAVRKLEPHLKQREQENRETRLYD